MLEKGAILSLLFVNLLDNGPLMLERIAFGKSIQGMIQVLIDFPCLPILSQQPPQNPLSAHPLHRGRHSRFRCPLSLTGAGMSALALGGMGLAHTESRVHDGGLFDNEAIGIELADVLARVCV